MFRSLAYPIRQLSRTPSFTIPAIAGLALAIGASTAVFSVFSAMLLHSMGFGEADRIVAIWQSDQPHGQQRVEAAYADLLAWRGAEDVFSDVAIASSVNLDTKLFAGGEPEHVDGTTVSGNFFRVLGATPLAGRFFTDDDDRPGAPVRVVLSYTLWKNRFAGDEGVLGRTFQADGASVTVIGIALPEFDMPRDVALWLPLRAVWPDVEKNERLAVFRAIARLRPGVDVAAASARLNVLSRQLQPTLPPGTASYTPLIVPILDEVYGSARPAVWILLGAVLLVLLIASANVANMMLARGSERGRELAIRMAVGAERRRIVRLLLGESAVLATAAAGLGLLLAVGGIKVLVKLAPPEIPRLAEAALDLPVLAFGIALASLTVLLFGLGPALAASRRDPIEALKGAGARLTTGRSQTRVRRLLIIGEVALSAVLLSGAGLLVRSFAKLTALDPGFNPERILTFRITTELPGQESRRGLYTKVLDRLRTLPGVESAGAILIRPLSGTVGWDTTYALEGQPPTGSQANPNGNYEAISPDYFKTMGIRLISGRDFQSSDTSDSAGVVIISEGTARRHWPRENAVGHRVRLGRAANAPWMTVVGVVHEVRYREWEATRPDFYVPYQQRAQHRSDFVVRTHGDPWSLANAVRREVFAIDKNQPISNVTTMETLVSQTLARSRFNSSVLATLAGCAILLAGIGIYGVLSYSVAQRTAEIGIRVAIGATPLGIAHRIIGEGVTLVAMGAVAGLAVWALLHDLLQAQLFDITSLDPAALAAAILMLFFVGIVASAAPALRASATDPAKALQRG